MYFLLSVSLLQFVICHSEIGKNFNELWNMHTYIGKCTTEEEINKYLERIAELKAAVSE